jgi:hypothetical protein
MTFRNRYGRKLGVGRGRHVLTGLKIAAVEAAVSHDFLRSNI